MLDKKLKVLIVDDEFHIAMLIKKLIRWDEIGLECLQPVDNGEAAYRIVLEERPDIVITDIRMPKINGLDLIRMTRKIDEKAKFIVISGYKEFEYAHKALQYGVKNYLLKPINEEEMNKALKNICDAEEEERLRRSQGRLYRKSSSASEQIIKSNLLDKIIDKTEDSTKAEELAEKYHLMFHDGIYCGIVIKLDYWDYEKSDKKQDAITMDKVGVMLDERLQNDVFEYMISKRANLNIYCLLNYGADKSKAVKSIIGNILSDIQEYLIGLEQYKITIGIGQEVEEFDKISESLQEAQKAVQSRIKLGTGRLIYSDFLRRSLSSDLDQYLSPYKEQYRMSVESLSKESIETVIHQIYGAFQSAENMDFSLCYELAHELIDRFFRYITIQNNEGKQLASFIKNACWHCYTIEQLTGLLTNYLGNHLQRCLKLLEIETAKPVRQAKQYISEHYQEKIMLEDIAAIVDLNPVYFSVLFKKETGMNFSAYLLHVRMETAKEMIRGSNKTIAAVANEVGYKDTRHFSQVFTKTVGVKPALYRKLYS